MDRTRPHGEPPPSFRTNTPLHASPFWSERLNESSASEDDAELVRRFRSDGYLVLEGFIEPETIEAAARDNDRLFDPDSVIDAPEETLHELRRDPTRIQDAWKVSSPVHRLAAHPKVLSLLELLYGRAPIPYQTLNFSKGSGQGFHSDAMSFSSKPGGFLCGVWVALEDVTMESGPLVGAVGSHRLPTIELSDLGAWAGEEGNGLGDSYKLYEEYVGAQLKQSGADIRPMPCKKGTVILWAANFIHAGAPVVDQEATRHSQVTHYLFEDCIYFTPMFSNPALGEYCLRNVRDIRTNEPVAHSLNRETLHVENVGYEDRDLYRLKRIPAGASEDPPTLLADIQSRSSQRVQHVKELEEERDRLRQHAIDLKETIRHMEGVMDKTFSRPLYRFRSALTKLMIRG